MKRGGGQGVLIGLGIVWATILGVGCGKYGPPRWPERALTAPGPLTDEPRNEEILPPDSGFDEGATEEEPTPEPDEQDPEA